MWIQMCTDWCTDLIRDNRLSSCFINYIESITLIEYPRFNNMKRIDIDVYQKAVYVKLLRLIFHKPI